MPPMVERIFAFISLLFFQSISTTKPPRARSPFPLPSEGFSVAEKLSDVSVKSGLGLKSLRERAQLSSGVLTIGSELGRGTIIAVVWDAAALRG